MPQEPKKKHSKARKRTRRAAIKLLKPPFVKCPNCQELLLPHRACKSCGFYKGKRIPVKTKTQVTQA